MNIKTFITPKYIVPLVALILALLIPAIFGDNQYTMLLITNVILYAVLATAWNIIGGLGGQFDLSAGAYLGIGSFTAGTLLLRWNITPWIGMIVGGLLATVLALLVGIPLFRFKVREVWYALSSAALVEVLRVAFTMWESVGGPTERSLPYHDWSLYHLRFGTYVPYYYILLTLLVIALLVNIWVRHTKLGYSLLALAEDEDAAEMIGVDARASKIKALMIFAFLVGVTGAIAVLIKGNIHPKAFSAIQSTEIAILGVIGGMGISYGPMLAALLMVSSKEILRAQLGGGLEGLYMVVYAAILILIALFNPRGIAVILQNLINRIKKQLFEDKDGKTADATGH